MKKSELIYGVSLGVAFYLTGINILAGLIPHDENSKMIFLVIGVSLAAFGGILSIITVAWYISHREDKMRDDKIGMGEQKYKSKWWLGIAFELVLIIIFSYLFSYGFLKEVNINVQIAIVSGLFGILGWSIQSENQRRIEFHNRLFELEKDHKNRLAQIRLQTYNDRKEIYESLLKPFMEAFLVATEKKDIKEEMKKMGEEMRKKMVEDNINIHLLGSDETCRIWEEWLKLARRGEVKNEDIQKKRNVALILFYARLVLSIRRDLGYEETEINEEDFISSFITDIKAYENELKEARKWKKADEVP